MSVVGAGGCGGVKGDDERGRLGGTMRAGARGMDGSGGVAIYGASLFVREPAVLVKYGRGALGTGARTSIGTIGCGGKSREYETPSSPAGHPDFKLLVPRFSSIDGTPRPSTGNPGKANLPLSGVGTNEEFSLAKDASRVRRGVGKDASRVRRGVGREIESSGGVGMYAHSTRPPPPESASGTRYGRGTGQEPEETYTPSIVGQTPV